MNVITDFNFIAQYLKNFTSMPSNPVIFLIGLSFLNLLKIKF